MQEVSGKIGEFLAPLPLFRGLPDNQLDALAAIALKHTYAKGETIFWQEDEGRGFFVVLSGKVKIFKHSPEGKEQILQFFGPGEHFAEVTAFDGQSYPASAAAVEPTQLLLFPRQSFMEFLQQHPTLAIRMLAIFARHLRRLTQLVEDLSLKEVPARLAAYLLYLSKETEIPEEVELDVTKGQLAAFLGTIPETLSRVFARFAKEGAIAINGSKIKLLDRQRLATLASNKF